jgi:hypothetical protein
VRWWFFHLRQEIARGGDHRRRTFATKNAGLQALIFCRGYWVCDRTPNYGKLIATHLTARRGIIGSAGIEPRGLRGRPDLDQALHHKIMESQ